MALTTFDTLKYANALNTAGVTDKKAEAEANIFAELMQVNLKELATKQDLEQLGKDLRNEMAQLQLKTSAEIHSVDAKMDRLYAQLRGEQILLRWMVGFVLAGVVGLLIRLFLMKGSL